MGLNIRIQLFCAVHIVLLPSQHDSALLYLFANTHPVMLLFIFVLKKNKHYKH